MVYRSRVVLTDLLIMLIPNAMPATGAHILGECKLVLKQSEEQKM